MTIFDDMRQGFFTHSIVDGTNRKTRECGYGTADMGLQPSWPHTVMSQWVYLRLGGTPMLYKSGERHVTEIWKRGGGEGVSCFRKNREGAIWVAQVRSLSRSARWTCVLPLLCPPCPPWSSWDSKDRTRLHPTQPWHQLWSPVGPFRTHRITTEDVCILLDTTEWSKLIRL